MGQGDEHVMPLVIFLSAEECRSCYALLHDGTCLPLSSYEGQKSHQSVAHHFSVNMAIYMYSVRTKSQHFFLAPLGMGRGFYGWKIVGIGAR